MAVFLEKFQLLINGQAGTDLFKKILKHDGGALLVIVRIQTTTVVNQCLEAAEAPLPFHGGAGFLAEEIQNLERGNFAQVVLQHCLEPAVGGMVRQHLDDPLQDLCGLVVEALCPHLL